jgi:hypothetical protein
VVLIGRPLVLICTDMRRMNRARWSKLSPAKSLIKVPDAPEAMNGFTIMSSSKNDATELMV